MPAIDHSLVDIALTRVPGGDFEKFVNAFLPAITGIKYVPLGGVHDGGADAFQDTGLYEGALPTTFYQASIQANHRAKIRHTVKRLRESGRAPRSLVYVTAQTVKMLDKDEESLSKETEVFVRIRDAGWIICSHQPLECHHRCIRNLPPTTHFPSWPVSAAQLSSKIPSILIREPYLCLPRPRSTKENVAKVN